MIMKLGLYAKAIGGAVAAAGAAAITALSDGNITPTEWVTIAIAFCGSLGAVWAVPNMPAGVAKYAKMITGAIVAGLTSLATAYVSGNTLQTTDLLHIGLAVLGSLGIVYVTPNSAQSDDLTPAAVAPADDDAWSDADPGEDELTEDADPAVESDPGEPAAEPAPAA